MTANLLATVLLATQQIAAPDTLLRPDVVMTVQGNATLFRGNRVRILIRTDHDAYLTLYRVDTEGKVSVLFPSSPDSQRIWTPMVSRGVADPMGRLENNTFTVHDYSGTGYLFVIASPAPFDYARMRDSSGWNIDGLIEGGRMTEDADAMIADIAVATLPDTVPFSYDAQRYLVGVTLPPIVALPCPTCNPFTGQPFATPIREWCATFRPEPYADPWDAHAVRPILVSAAVGAPAIGMPAADIYPSDVVASPRGVAKPRERVGTRSQPATTPLDIVTARRGASNPRVVASRPSSGSSVPSIGSLAAPRKRSAPTATPGHTSGSRGAPVRRRRR